MRGRTNQNAFLPSRRDLQKQSCERCSLDVGATRTGGERTLVEELGWGGQEGRHSKPQGTRSLKLGVREEGAEGSTLGKGCQQVIAFKTYELTDFSDQMCQGMLQ